VNPIENDVSKAAGKINQIKTAFREAHDELTNFPYTTAHTNILGTTNIVRITQKVPFSFILLYGVPLTLYFFQTIDQRAHLTSIVDSGKLLESILAPRFEDYQPPMSYNNGRGHSRRSYQSQPRRDDSYHSGRDSRHYGPSGSGSAHGDRYYPANKRRRY
jgi:hypothetical protein